MNLYTNLIDIHSKLLVLHHFITHILDLHVSILFLFLLLIYFEYDIGPIKLRVKDIKNLQDRTRYNTAHTHFTNIINITESDYEDLWNIRADYWFHNWGKPRTPIQIDISFISSNIEIDNNLQQLEEAQLEIHPQIPKNLGFPISKQKITGIHQVQTILNAALIESYSRNHNIPQPAITTFTNETKHNKTHKRSRRIIDKNLKPSNNTISTGPPTGPQDIFVEHYDCEINEISNVKYYELNKISTCTFKPMDLEMEKTGLQLLSRAKAIEIKAFAVDGTIKETVHWCSQLHLIKSSKLLLLGCPTNKNIRP